MTATVLDGRIVAQAVAQELAAKVAALVPQAGRRPVLAIVIIGDDPASHTYGRMKVNRCREVGIEPRKIELPETTTTQEALAAVRGLNDEPEVDGILVHYPAPPQVDEALVFEAIDPAKDVDGVTSASLASMAFGGEGFCSATPGGVMRLLERYGITPEGKRAVVVGRSRILGIPMGLLLLGHNATVTYCHSGTPDLRAALQDADLVVAAAGRPELIKGEWINAGAVVVDAGYMNDTGDVEYEAAAQRAGWITPMPGGVGPMTIACLLEQTVAAYQRRTGVV